MLSSLAVKQKQKLRQKTSRRMNLPEGVLLL